MGATFIKRILMATAVLAFGLTQASETDDLQNWLSSLTIPASSVQQLKKFAKEGDVPFDDAAASAYIDTVRKKLFGTVVQRVAALEHDGTCTPKSFKGEWQSFGVKGHGEFEKSLGKVESVGCLATSGGPESLKKAFEMYFNSDFRRTAIFAFDKTAYDAEKKILCDRLKGKGFPLNIPKSSYCVQIEEMESGKMISAHSSLLQSPMPGMDKDAQFYLREGMITFVDLGKAGIGVHQILYLRSKDIPAMFSGRALDALGSAPEKFIEHLNADLAHH